MSANAMYRRLRPKSWGEVIGQEKAVNRCRALIRTGIGGRALWIVGASGTGKTTIAYLCAAEIADPLCVEEIDAGDLTEAKVKELERESHYRGIGEKTGRVYIVNEAHGLKRTAVRQLLVMIERIPAHVLWIFTTTNAGEAALFEGQEDAHPLIGRCKSIELARQGIAAPFAQYLESVDPVGPRPAKFYLRLIQDCKNSLRMALDVLESDGLDAMGADASTAPQPDLISAAQAE